MRHTFLILFILSAAIACTPKNEEVKDEQVDIDQPQETLDSVSSTEKDGLKIYDNEITSFPLPQPVLQLLAQKYPGYTQPALLDGIGNQTPDTEQGPFIVRGDFTNDLEQDYALQLQQDKNIIIVAVINTNQGNWILHELKRDILFNDRGSLKSMYYLSKAEPGKVLIDIETGVKLKLKHEAISVDLEKDITTYVYQNNNFKPYSTPD
jgi:hypothetical protein